jgi:hypothetical protein
MTGDDWAGREIGLPFPTSPVVDSSKSAPVYDPEADHFDNPEKLAGYWQEMIKGMVQANLFTRSNFIKKTCLTQPHFTPGFWTTIARSPVVSSWYIDRSTPA